MFQPSLRLIRRLFLAAALLWAVAAPAAAQQPLALRIQDGRVTLQARDVTVRQILSEWARIGGTRIVNAERIGGGPVTLEFSDLPERQALDILLRNVAGYVLGARQSPVAGGSTIDRILILATSNAPPARPVAPPAFVNGPAARIPRPNVVQPPPQPEVDPDDPEENPVEDIGPDDQAEPQLVRPGGAPRPGMPVVVPFGQTQPEPDGEPSDGGGVIVSPGNPFGVPPGSSATPGTVTPVPQPNPPQNRTPRIQDPD